MKGKELILDCSEALLTLPVTGADPWRCSEALLLLVLRLMNKNKNENGIENHYHYH